MADPTFMALIGGLGFLMKFVPANLKFLVSLEYVKTWNMPWNFVFSGSYTQLFCIFRVEPEPNMNFDCIQVFLI